MGPHSFVIFRGLSTGIGSSKFEYLHKNNHTRAREKCEPGQNGAQSVQEQNLYISTSIFLIIDLLPDLQTLTFEGEKPEMFFIPNLTLLFATLLLLHSISLSQESSTEGGMRCFFPRFLRSVAFLWGPRIVWMFSLEGGWIIISPMQRPSRYHYFSVSYDSYFHFFH